MRTEEDIIDEMDEIFKNWLRPASQNVKYDYFSQDISLLYQDNCGAERYYTDYKDYIVEIYKSWVWGLLSDEQAINKLKSAVIRYNMREREDSVKVLFQIFQNKAEYDTYVALRRACGHLHGADMEPEQRLIIQRAMQSNIAEVQFPFCVYRLDDFSSILKSCNRNIINQGDLITFDDYISTSIKLSELTGNENLNDRDTVIIIGLRERTRGLYIRYISQNKDEHEFIINEGYTFYVETIQDVGKKKLLILELNE